MTVKIMDQISHGLVGKFIKGRACSSCVLYYLGTESPLLNPLVIMRYRRQSGGCFFTCWLCIAVCGISMLLSLFSLYWEAYLSCCWCVESIIPSVYCFSFDNIYLFSLWSSYDNFHNNLYCTLKKCCTYLFLVLMVIKYSSNNVLFLQVNKSDGIGQ